jgi:glycosyltransferase involved in cell wall biosynthesis
VTPPALTLNKLPVAAAGSEPVHVAMIAPPYFDVPPAGYGGVEAVVADLVDALVDRGHRVTLIGAGQHHTMAQRFLATYQRQPADQLGEALPEVVHTAKVARLLEDLDVDVVHDHTLAGPLLARGRTTPTVVTGHGPATGELGAYYRSLGSTIDLVAISDAQRARAPELAWTATVHNAIRADTFPFREGKDEFALFLGRFHPDKAPHLAIEAARAVRLPIVLAGKCAEPAERAYFDREVQPRLGSDTTMFGVADAAAKRDLLSRAACLLFPICWDEPFGLVMIEAMACGTPVVALRRGAVPEIVLAGQTGVIVDHPDELAAAIGEARRLDPWVCRKHVEQNFTVEVMAARYEAVYRRAVAGLIRPAGRAGSPGSGLRPPAVAGVLDEAGRAPLAQAPDRGLPVSSGECGEC